MFTGDQPIIKGSYKVDIRSDPRKDQNPDNPPSSQDTYKAGQGQIPKRHKTERKDTAHQPSIRLVIIYSVIGGRTQ